MPLIPDQDVRDLLPDQDRSDEQLASVNKLVASWLRRATGLATLPDPLPEEHPLYGPAFELIVLELTNPERLQSSGYGPKTRTFGTDAQRKAILDDVRETYLRAAQSPIGCFPQPEHYPELGVAPWRRW